MAAGRRLLVSEDPAKLSLRRIAAEAGYSPGTIYRYFPDQRALYRAVREQDMEQAIARFKRIASRTRDPAERVRKLFAGTVRYWLAHADKFDVLFAQPEVQVHIRTEGEPFGQSSVAQRALGIYYSAVESYLDSLPQPPLPSRLAADALLGAVYGIIAFPRMTPTMAWSNVAKMADMIVAGMLAHWSNEAHARQSRAQR